MRASLVSILFLLLFAPAKAQEFEPLAVLDTSTIRIGEQATLTLSIPYNAQEPNEIEFPEIFETIGERIEVIQAGEVNAAVQTPDDNPYLMVRSQQLVITCWDSGFAAIPPLTFRVNGTEVETEALLLEVRGMQVDTSAAPKDIKPIEELPFSLAYWFTQHWKWFAGAAGILTLAYLVFILGRNLPRKNEEAVPEVTLPLHVRTIEKLEQIERAGLWQKGKTKVYYTQVSETIRGYIEERFKVPALERTTFEIEREIKLSGMSRVEQEALVKGLLEPADMVKFAKYNPIGVENESLMRNAFEFVRNTSIDQLSETSDVQES